jgi:hypothetical protein
LIGDLVAIAESVGGKEAESPITNHPLTNKSPIANQQSTTIH